MLTDLIIFGSIAAQKICKQMTYSVLMQFVYKFYRIEKQEIFCMLSMVSLRFAVVPVSRSFKSLFSPHNLRPLFRNSLLSFIAP